MNYLLLIAVIIVLIIEAILVYYLVKQNSLRKLISSSKTSRISNLRDGFHVIKGRVIAKSETLVSPYAEIACVYYDFQLDEKRKTGNTSMHGIVL